MRLVAKLAFSIGVLIAFTTVIVGQKPQTPTPPPKAPDMEKVDKIHESVFSKTNKADEAAKLTEEMAKALPGAAKVGPVTRKNYIDENLFTRMDRDKIPHAGLSTDEEFIRRVYMDATGRRSFGDHCSRTSGSFSQAKTRTSATNLSTSSLAARNSPSSGPGIGPICSARTIRHITTG